MSHKDKNELTIINNLTENYNKKDTYMFGKKHRNLMQQQNCNGYNKLS